MSDDKLLLETLEPYEVGRCRRLRASDKRRMALCSIELDRRWGIHTYVVPLYTEVQEQRIWDGEWFSTGGYTAGNIIVL